MGGKNVHRYIWFLLIKKRHALHLHKICWDYLECIGLQWMTQSFATGRERSLRRAPCRVKVNNISVMYKCWHALLLLLFVSESALCWLGTLCWLQTVPWGIKPWLPLFSIIIGWTLHFHCLKWICRVFLCDGASGGGGGQRLSFIRHIIKLPRLHRPLHSKICLIL